MKPLTAILGVAVGICLVSPGARTYFQATAANAAAPAAQVAAATTTSTTTAAPPLAPTKAKDGMYVRGVKMPAGCQADKYPELVAYVTQHPDRVSDADIPDYVCGVN